MSAQDAVGFAMLVMALEEWFVTAAYVLSKQCCIIISMDLIK